MISSSNILRGLRDSSAFGWLRVEHELDDEFQSHLEMRIEENIRLGMSHDEAEEDARERFGDIHRLRQECAEARHENPWQRMASLLRIALLLGLGMGAALAVLILVDKTMLHPLPINVDSDQLLIIWGEHKATGRENLPVSMPDFQDWADQSTSFSDMGLYHYRFLQNRKAKDSAKLLSLRGSAGYFRILKPIPWLGRSFEPEDFIAESSSVVLLSYDFWNAEYEANPDIIGKQLTFDGDERTIVGVLGPDFEPYNRSDIFFPLPVQDYPNYQSWRGQRQFYGLVQLRSGVNQKDAEEELNTIASDIALRSPETNKGFHWYLQPLQQAYAAPARSELLLLLGSVALLLLIITIGAVQNSILLRSAEKVSSRRRSLYLITGIVFGGLLALPVGIIGADLLKRLFLEDIAHVFNFDVNIRLVSLAALLTLCVGVSIVVMMFFAKFSRSQTWTWNPFSRGFLLTAMQGGGAITIAVCAGLMVLSLGNLEGTHLGYNAKDLLTMHVILPYSRYPGKIDQARFFLRAMQGIDSLSGVQKVSGSESIPLRSSRFSIPFTILDSSRSQTGEQPWAEFCRVGIDYHELMEIPLLTGRYFDSGDGGRSPHVLVINRAMAEKYWPGESPIGQKVWLNHHPEERTIVGVVENVRSHGPREEPVPRIYRCYWQYPSSILTLIARVEGDKTTIAELMQGVVKRIDPDLVPGEVISSKEILSAWHEGYYRLVIAVSAIGLLGFLIVLFTLRRVVAEEARYHYISAESDKSSRFVLWNMKGAILPMILFGCIGLFFALQSLDEFLFEAEQSLPILYIVMLILAFGMLWGIVWIPARRLLQKKENSLQSV